MRDIFTFIKNKIMEFKEYGPLAQSKEMATNKKTSWVPVVLYVAVGFLGAYVLFASIRDKQPWNNINKGNDQIG